MKTYDGQQLYVGAPRDASLAKTTAVITGKLRGLGRLRGTRLLDVGCGDGTFTRILGGDFERVYGIDVQDPFLGRFRDAVGGDGRYEVRHMSASEMTFEDEFFDSVVSIETLEHVPDLAGAASEICRVLRHGGEVLVTVPNRWFPFENHGMRVGPKGWHGRVPLLTYLPWLHRRISLARVFTVGDLDRLFVPRGLVRSGVDYAWPTFEHGGNKLQPLLKPLFGTMRRMEASPLRMFGTSVVVCYTKP